VFGADHMRLLIVEDDQMLGDSLRRALNHAGYAVDWMLTGDDGLIAALDGGYDTILLDLELPVLDGVGFLKALRARRNATPVIVLTARDARDQKVDGLDAGADDYMVKPFDLDELLARIRAQIRRRDLRGSDVLSIGGLTLDMPARSVIKDGVAVGLTAKEFKVLVELARRMGRFVSKAELENALYDDAASIESNTVEVAIYALRRKLGAGLIMTVRGLGYMIGAPS
jgi:DNA-binding response OmpR family regulator